MKKIHNFVDQDWFVYTVLIIIIVLSSLNLYYTEPNQTVGFSINASISINSQENFSGKTD